MSKETKKHECIRRVQGWLKLAETGDAFAQNNLGAILAKGDVCVEKSEDGAVYWYAQAIKKGYVPAKWNLATMIKNGEGGLEINIPYALMMMDQAALEGETTACLFLSDIYRDGAYGVTRDPVKSEMYKRMLGESTAEDKPICGKPINIEKDLAVSLVKPEIRFL